METLGSTVVVKSRTTLYSPVALQLGQLPGDQGSRRGLPTQSRRTTKPLVPVPSASSRASSHPVGWQQRSPFGSGPGLFQGLEEREARGLQDSRPGTSWLATWPLTCPAGACNLRHLNGLSLVPPRGKRQATFLEFKAGFPTGLTSFGAPPALPPLKSLNPKFGSP